MRGRAEPRPAASDALLAGAILATLPKTRVRAFDFSASTFTEPLAFLSSTSHRSSSTFSCELASDLVGFLSEDPLLALSMIEYSEGRAAEPDWWPPYSYVRNSPLSFRDPMGLKEDECLKPCDLRTCNRCCIRKTKTDLKTCRRTLQWFTLAHLVCRQFAFDNFYRCIAQCALDHGDESPTPGSSP